MKKLAGLILLATIFLLACTSKEVPAALLSTPASVAAPRAAWEQAWEKVVNEARKEGRVLIHGSIRESEVQQFLRQAFRAKYGIVLEIEAAGRGSESMQKFTTTRRAGLYLYDIYIGGATSGVNTFKPAGIFDPLDAVLILPEVVDPRMWTGGKLEFVDKEHTIFPYFSYSQSPLGINSNLVKPGDIKAHIDLLEPKWKGNMVLQDPTTAGTAASWFAVVSKTVGLDFMRELVKQDLIVTRDREMQMMWMAQGKYPVGIAASSSDMSRYINEGAPLKRLSIDGTYWVSGTYNISLINRAPNPNAASVFINWFLGREVQTMVSKWSRISSRRADVPTDHVDPETIARPEDYPAFGEAFILGLPNQMKIAQEIFGHLLR